MGKVAIITGAASGIGLATAKSLAQKGGWRLHLLDQNAVRGQDAVREIGACAEFHQADISNYRSLASAFKRVFDNECCLDFVFANAGIIEDWDFYDKHPLDKPPPEVDYSVVDVNVKGAMSTCYLALHYFRQSPGKDRSLVLTASCTSFYPSRTTAVYSATKHAILGFMRSIAGEYHDNDIRVNAICPGSVRTNLISEEGYSGLAPELATPLENVTKVVDKLINEAGDDLIDTTGTRLRPGEIYGQAVEISVDNLYFRNHIDFCDNAMRRMMKETEA
ncbi:hypothetical protein QQZ08_007933 [Neonectria magnoliae]|uniref:NAD(P)-binding protein n=1 Tax=Neonectria magnoliae TaxID=2732573 RepID=A0ABR1HWJ4_9HYPO